MRTPRIAVVGSGPAGLFTVAALDAMKDGPLRIDVIDRLPAPFGLVRYGVAPDHAHIKAVTRILARPFERDHVRYFGNVTVGRDLTHDDLVACYDAVAYALGAERSRRLAIPGEELEGYITSTEFVRWYNGHPDEAGTELALDMEQVAVIGAGNVALDIARVLARTAEELRGTDVPARVLTTLGRSAVRDIHVLIRRRARGREVHPGRAFATLGSGRRGRHRARWRGGHRRSRHRFRPAHPAEPGSAEGARRGRTAGLAPSHPPTFPHLSDKDSG